MLKKSTETATKSNLTDDLSLDKLFKLKGQLFSLPIILSKHAYYTNATKCIMTYKFAPHYTFGSTATIYIFAKN